MTIGFLIASINNHEKENKKIMNSHKMLLIHQRKAGLILILFLLSFKALWATIEISNVSPATDGLCNGSFKVVANGTAGPFNILVESEPGANLIHNQDGVNGSITISDLCAGNYSIIVTNAFQCEKELEVTIASCEEISMNTGSICPKIYHPTSCGSNDGSLRFIGGCGPEGGTPPYTFLWNNGDTDLALSGLSEGTYTLTITDANGCTGTESYELIGQDANQILDAFIQHPCDGGSNGSIELFIIGPEGYDISWSNGENSEYIDGLSEGEYCVTVTNGPCEATACYTLESSSQAPLEIRNFLEHACYNQNDGYLIVWGGGGISPYTYQWSNGVEGSSLFNLAPGTYSVTITDACNAQLTASYTIENTAPLEIDGNVSPSCPDDELNYTGGSINLTVNGGSAPFSYNWSDGGHGGNRYSLSPGQYCVTVFDTYGCSASECFNVGQYDLEIHIADFQNCEGGDCSQAFIDIEVAGSAVGPYQYNWFAYLDNEYFTFEGEDLNNIPEADRYCVTVRDANFCKYRRCIDIDDCHNVPSPSIENSLVVPDSDLFPGGLILMDILPEDADFSVSWQGPNGFSSTADELSPAGGPGNYTVTVDNGCGDEVTENFTIEECNLDVEVININSACSNEGYASFEVRINNVSAEDVFYYWNGSGFVYLPTSFDPATSSATARSGRGSAGQFQIAILNQDYCGGVANFEIQSSGIHAYTEPFTDFIFLGGGFFYPVQCAEVTYCQGNPVDFEVIAPVSIDAFYNPQNSHACDLQVSCGDQLLDVIPGGIQEGLIINQNSCEEGEFCIGTGAMYDPVFAELVGLPSDWIDVQLQAPLNTTYLGPIEEDLAIENGRCVLKRFCNGQLIDEREVGTPFLQTECGLNYGYDNNTCVDVTYCGSEAVSVEVNPFYDPFLCCPRPIVTGEEGVAKSLVDKGLIKDKLLFSDVADRMPKYSFRAKQDSTQIRLSQAGIEEAPSIPGGEKIEVFPNPFTGLITVRLNTAEKVTAEEEMEVVILNTLGQVVFQRSVFVVGNAFNMNLNSLDNGAYLMKVFDDQGKNWISKIVKAP